MIHIVVRNQKSNAIRHEYWETEKYKKYLQDLCGRWTPYYVCYTYPNVNYSAIELPRIPAQVLNNLER